jgi:hypothetical protein
VTSLSDYKTNNNGSGYNNKGKGKDNNSGGNRRVVFRDLKVKRYIIKKRPND